MHFLEFFAYNSWIDYEMGLTHVVNNSISADYQPNSAVTNLSKILFFRYAFLQISFARSWEKIKKLFLF